MSRRERDSQRRLFELYLARLRDEDVAAALEEKEKAAAAEPSRRSESAPPRLARRVGRRDFRPAEEIDLHGFDRRSAIASLDVFLGRQAPGSIVRIIHGKGRRVLARAITERLTNHPAVAEHVEAPRRWGGAGARLVRLR